MFIISVCKDSHILIRVPSVHSSGRSSTELFLSKEVISFYACADWFRLDTEPSSATVTFVHT